MGCYLGYPSPAKRICQGKGVVLKITPLPHTSAEENELFVGKGVDLKTTLLLWIGHLRNEGGK